MEIELRNIGIVRETSIQLDGLTVVTGKNESGKTTIGKALYALLNALSSFKENADKDKLNYISFNLVKLSITSEILDAIKSLKESALQERYPHLSSLASRGGVEFSNSMEAEEFVEKLETELSNFQRLWDTDLEEILFDPILQSFLRKFTPRRKRRKSEDEEAVAERRANESALRSVRSQIVLNLKSLRTLLKDIQAASELTSYVRTSLDQSLNKEFCKQIQPVNCNITNSSIILRSDTTQAFEVKIQQNRVEKLDFLPKSLQDQSAFFFDDLSIFDQITELERFPFRARFIGFQEETGENIFFDPSRVTPHAAQLRSALQKTPDVYRETILDEKLKLIREKINAVIPGTFLFAQSGMDMGGYYLQPDGSKLNLSNMSSGSKTFAAIKILLENGLLNENTTLILDEPEIHLHPEWQNQFAEVVILLVKELHVRVFLTTHSPNFMLALDAYMRQYEIMERTHFYQAQRVDEKSVTHQEVTNQLDVIYKEFLEPLTDMNAQKNFYADNEGGDEEA